MKIKHRTVSCNLNQLDLFHWATGQQYAKTTATLNFAAEYVRRVYHLPPCTAATIANLAGLGGDYE